MTSLLQLQVCVRKDVKLNYARVPARFNYITCSLKIQ